MKSTKSVICLAACVMLLIGCASSPRAPQGSGGGGIKIMVLSDRGNPADMNERQYQWRNEVGEWMERDLLNKLKRKGLQPVLIKSKDKFVPGVDQYLLTIKIVSYNPGSSAARMLVGFGAGSCALDCHYEFYGKNRGPILSWDDGVGTSGDWRRLPRKLNDKTIAKIMQQFKTSQ